ncbi:MAG TPA: hemin receptor [Cytophagales bacterium]|nr:hemin receptor [Cytophagales bacterium]HAA18957.1 hemin receptor [Cytophagales bacterium]HAP64791.1 hemin receptor [Cytophagales bacterium]
MTEKDKELVQDSFQHVIPIADEVGLQFYNTLFENAPEARSMFPEDITAQSKKLMELLTYAISSLDNLDVLVPEVKKLGQRHVGYGVKPEHYGLVATALLTVLEDKLGEAWTPELKNAWVQVYTVLANTMQEA